jgi:hypothetical protein
LYCIFVERTDCWRSKVQQGVTLSSSEAEYVAISEAVKEIKLFYFLLNDIHVEVKLPIIMKTDNVGAIFMSENASTGDTLCENSLRMELKIEFFVQRKMNLMFSRKILIWKHVKNIESNSVDEYTG